MAMTDPIADMLTRIRNATFVDSSDVSMPSSRVKTEIARVLENEGYISGFEVTSDSAKAKLTIQLKYYNSSSVIERIDRVSKPGRRVYCGVGELPLINGGLGVAILSTSKGVMTAQDAKKAGIGGEVICFVS